MLFTIQAGLGASYGAREYGLANPLTKLSISIFFKYLRASPLFGLSEPIIRQKKQSPSGRFGSKFNTKSFAVGFDVGSFAEDVETGPENCDVYSVLLHRRISGRASNTGVNRNSGIHLE
jgi:hypothetical protein